MLRELSWPAATAILLYVLMWLLMILAAGLVSLLGVARFLLVHEPPRDHRRG